MNVARVWAIVDDGTPRGRPVEMHRTPTGWRADMAVHADTTKYTALIGGKFVDYPAACSAVRRVGNSPAGVDPKARVVIPKLVLDGEVSAIFGVPGDMSAELYVRGAGGLSDVAVSDDWRKGMKIQVTIEVIE